MIVFSDAWWIGTKVENPEELQLQFPEELNKEKDADHDFKGGVGATCDGNPSPAKSAMKSMERDPKVHLDDDLTDTNDMEELVEVTLVEVTPTRHSARLLAKHSKASSPDDLIGNGDETPEAEDEEADIGT